MKDWRTKVDVSLTLAIAATAVIVFVSLRPGNDTGPEQTATFLTPSTETTAVAIPTETAMETEPVFMEETTVPETAAAEPTEAPVTLYDIPLSQELQLHIIGEAEAHGIDPAIVFAMAYRESTYNAGCIGDSGASLGLLQVQPYWHKGRMERLGCPDLLDPFQNATVAIDYLSELLGQYGSMEKALVAYNRGHYSGTVTEYARAVLNIAEGLRGETYVLYR